MRRSGPLSQRLALVGFAALALLPSGRAGAREHPETGTPLLSSAPLAVVRNVRDGVLGIGDAMMDGSTALFGEASVLVAKLTMGASDAAGLLDDNPLSRPAARGFFSKHLAKTAYFWHVAGSETLLGGHGLEVERWALGEVARLNPLLGDPDIEALEGPLPLDPLEFVGDGWIHAAVYRTHSTLAGVGAIATCDVILRPVGGVLRILQLPGWGAAFETRGEEIFRKATRFAW